MSDTESAKVNKYQSIKSFLSGGFGGMCLVFVGHPFDLIKVRLQTSKEYTGLFNAVKTIFAKEGIKGLYRGMATPLVGVTPIFAICFWGYDLGKSIAKTLWRSGPDEPLAMSQILFAGGFSAIPATALMAPSERIKVLLQTQGAGKEKLYSGPIDAAAKLYKEGGMRSIFRGTGATLARDIPGSVAYFGAYEITKKLLTPAGSTPDQLNSMAVLFAGGAAGIANWAVAIPADVVKSRLQSAPEGMYTGAVDVFSKLVKNEGPGALFRGLGPAMIRAFPANAACFFGVEVSKKALDKLF
ncbi:mitochondrial carrier [Rozella allomycis CSF55]|uniref:Mitochondrial carrier n=1 Tax=Rozella allomycis (strain CSF55) TaxID=988480 RepID=A0A075AW81_ROZAC|nr:Mitochondrial substrate/solute carrier domain-containing protein [Rozella allomycis CSF55]RKP20277.1 mitochondrial carrier [Rozella allomycis CSF55]|eukprot:EPZ34510.1 Mitochondrial substrate/solute carrier domain-containing protein [Rozella allomycis CSF55]